MTIQIFRISKFSVSFWKQEFQKEAVPLSQFENFFEEVVFQAKTLNVRHFYAFLCESQDALAANQKKLEKKL